MRQSNLKMENNLPWKLQPTRAGKKWKNITSTENSNGHRIERPIHISLLNSSQKASRYATRRQINSANDSIAACKLQKLFKISWQHDTKIKVYSCIYKWQLVMKIIAPNHCKLLPNYRTSPVIPVAVFKLTNSAIFKSQFCVWKTQDAITKTKVSWPANHSLKWSYTDQLRTRERPNFKIEYFLN